MIDREAAFIYHFFEVAITEGVAQIPADAEQDDLGLIVTSHEGIGFGHMRDKVRRVDCLNAAFKRLNEFTSQTIQVAGPRRT
jgi:hypothetical protein